MVKRTIIAPPDGERLVNLLNDIRKNTGKGDTRSPGQKVLGENDDILWGGTDANGLPADFSIRDISGDLIAAEGRLADAEASLAESQERLDAAELTVAETKDRLTTVETETIPNAVAQLEAADSAAAQELSTLDGKLATAQQELDAAEANLNTLQTVTLPQLQTDLEAADAAAKTQLEALDGELATAQGDLATAKGAIDTLRSDLAAEATAREQLSASVAADLGELDTALQTAFPQGAFDVSAELAQTIRDQIVEYAVSSSETTAPTTGWSALTPTRSPGTFIWFRTAITYADNSISRSSAALLTGNAGAPGPKGEDGTGVTILGSFDTSAELPAMGSDGDAYLVAGDLYVWDSTTSSWENVGRIQGPEGPAGDKGDKGDAGTPGVSIASVTPYYRRQATGTAAPAKPTTMTPSGWTATEPDWTASTELFRTERVVYSNATFAYTDVTKVAVFAAIDLAMATANGKNLNTYSDLPIASKPGPAPAPDTSRTIGDIHRNRYTTTGEIWAEYQWTGTAWKQVTFGNEILTSLDVGKLTAGSAAIGTAVIDKLWTDGLVAKSAVFQQINVAAGNILTDPNGLNPNLRNNIGGAGWSWDDTGKYWKRAANAGGTTQFNAYTNTGSVYESNLLDPGAMYVITFEVWVDAVASNTGGRASIYLRRRDGSQSFIGDGLEAGGDTTNSDPVTVAGQWVKVERFWRAPSDSLSGGINFQLVGTAATATEVRIRNPFIGKQAASVLIEDGAISAQKIHAESVGAAVGTFVEARADKLVAGTGTIGTAVINKLFTEIFTAKKITASELSIGSVTGSAIADGAVDAVQIKDGAVSAAKINAQSVAGAVGTFIEANVSKLIADSTVTKTAVINKLWADGIVAKAVTTSRLAVTTGNLVPNGMGELGDNSSWPDFTYVSLAPGSTGATGGFRSNSGAFLNVGHDAPIPVQAGRSYLMDVWINVGTAGADTAIAVDFLNSSGSYMSNTYPIWPRGQALGLTYHEGSFTIPAGAAYIRFRIVPSHTNGTASTQTFYGFRVRPKSGTVLIEDGAITTPKLTVTEDMSASIVNAMSIASKKLVVTEEAILNHATLIGQTVVDDINVNGKIIGTDGVFTGTVDFANVNVTGTQIVNKLAANSISADKISGGSFVGKSFSGGTFSGTSFTGSSFIGGVFATNGFPSSNGGVHIDDTNGIRGWSTSGGSPTFHLNPSSGETRIRARFLATDENSRGMIIYPTTSTGAGGIFFTHTGDGDPSNAAVWRSSYTDNYQPLNVRGGSGAGVKVHGPLNIDPMGATNGLIMANAQIRNLGGAIVTGTVAANSDMYHYAPPTTSAGANMLIASSPEGRIYKSTSSRRYKKNIVDWAPAKDRVLALRPRQWQHADPAFPEIIDETWHVGFVAEEVDELGLDQLVKYVGDGSGGWIPDGLNYDRFAAAQQGVLVDHDSRIAELEAENAALRSRLDALEALILKETTA